MELDNIAGEINFGKEAIVNRALLHVILDLQEEIYAKLYERDIEEVKSDVKELYHKRLKKIYDTMPKVVLPRPEPPESPLSSGQHPTDKS